MKKLLKSLGLAILMLNLVACSRQNTAKVTETSQSQEKIEDKSEAKQEQENPYLKWQRDYRALSNISRLNTYGHMSFAGDQKVSMDRNETELVKGQEEGYLTADYAIKAYAGDQMISTIEYPFPADMHTAAGYPITEVTPEVQIDVTVSQSEIDRIGTEDKATNLTFYGYQTEDGYLILTDGKGAESKLYIYAPEEPLSYTVISDQANLRQEPRFDAKVLTTLKKDQKLTGSSSFVGETKDRNSKWVDVEVDGHKGYVWTGELLQDQADSSVSSSSTRSSESVSSSSITASASDTKNATSKGNSTQVSVERLKSGDMGALEGTWVSGNSTWNTWNINSYGGLGTGEILDLSNDWTSEVGVNLDLKYRSVATPVLFIPAGVAHGESDSSKDRLVFINSPEEKPKESTYFYKQ